MAYPHFWICAIMSYLFATATSVVISMHGPLTYVIDHSSTNGHPYTFGGPEQLTVLDSPELYLLTGGQDSQERENESQ